MGIRVIDALHKEDIRLPNEQFQLFGRIVPTYDGTKWVYELIRFAPENAAQMCFPDESYDYDSMTGSVFIGAYDADRCVGLAILQPGFCKYMLKVSRQYRGRHIGTMLIQKVKKTAAQNGHRGLYTQGQSNDLGAYLFTLHSGFYISGLDTNVYRHTK